VTFLKKYKLPIVYGLSLAILLVLLKLTEYHWLIIDHSMEIYTGMIALLFTLLGIWVAVKLFRPKKEVTIIEKEKIVEKEILVPASATFIQNKKAIDDAEISAREMEVLQLMANGLSNQEIADNLYVSVNTIKTHITNLFFKLEVTRRTQAVEKAKRLYIIP
jgi:ATP/maltotriose-dependent transcriptional regulator MalT